MKPIIYLLAVFSVLFVYSAEAYAQCDRSVQRPIKCGYYDEGYEDGMNDARSNRASDYRRYRNKVDTQYETFYRGGYEAGYSAAGPVNRPYPGPGGGGGNSSGTATWSGRVDNVVQLILQGNNLRAQDMTNSGMTTTNQNVNGYLPRRPVTVTANKFGGRGTVRVVQQPNRSNGFTAIVEISDPKGGADNYRVDINWESTGRAGGGEEPYQSGRVTWRGRVDNTVNISIAGSSVTSEATAGQPLVGENFSINGYLASRPGTVTVRKIRVRCNVSVLQQPTYENDFTAVIQVSDSGGGADDYQLEISW